MHAGSRAEVVQHGARLGRGEKRVRAGGDVIVSALAAGGHGPELEERAARETRMEDGGVRDDVREADVEREQRVSKVVVREEVSEAP
jgi:hypothetical protein